jgi:hypothetical protein
VSESKQLTSLDTERIANSAFEIVTRLNKDHFAAIVHYGSFADLTVCITEFCKVSKYQKISLLAIAMLRGVIPVMLECPECSLTPETTTKDSGEDNMIRYWFPVLFGFYDIIMNGEDLEVRRLCVSHTSPHQLLTQDTPQSSRFFVLYSQDLREHIHCGILGQRLSRAAISNLCRLEVKSGLVTLQHPRGHECLAFNNYDTSLTRPH